MINQNREENQYRWLQFKVHSNSKEEVDKLKTGVLDRVIVAEVEVEVGTIETLQFSMIR